MSVDNVLERALHLEALTIIKKEEQFPRTNAIRHDESNKSLVEAVNVLIQHLTGCSDSISREIGTIGKVDTRHKGGGISQVAVLAKAGYQGRKNFNQN